MTRCGSSAATARRSRSTPRSRSRSMVARRFDSSACSAWVSIFSRCLPLSRSVPATSPSTDPNWASSFCAVFSSHPRNARDVVHAVAGQPDQVDHLLRPLHPETLANRGHVVDLRRIAGHTRHAIEEHVVADELREVLVQRHHVGVEAGRLRARRQRADHVVRLHSVVGDHRQAHRLGDAAHVRQRGADVLRRLRARALVVGVLAVAPSGTGGVEHHRQVGGLLVVEDLQQGGGVAVHRRRVEAVGGDQGTVQEHEVGAVHQGHTVDEIEPFVSAGSWRHRVPSTAGAPVAPPTGCEAGSCAGSGALRRARASPRRWWR